MRCLFCPNEAPEPDDEVQLAMCLPCRAALTEAIKDLRPGQSVSGSPRDLRLDDEEELKK